MWIAALILLVALAVVLMAPRPAHAQLFNFGNFLVSLLLGIRNSFAGTPGLSFVVAILDAIIRNLGSIFSGIFGF